MSDFDDAVQRVQQAATVTGAVLREVRWANTASGNGHTLIVAADCTSYAAICDHLKAPRDGGRWSSGTANHRMYDALTKDNKVVIEHRCWPHLPCWKASS